MAIVGKVLAVRVHPPHQVAPLVADLAVWMQQLPRSPATENTYKFTTFTNVLLYNQCRLYIGNKYSDVNICRLTELYPDWCISYDQMI